MTIFNKAMMNRRETLALVGAATVGACGPVSNARSGLVEADAANQDIIRRTVAGDPQGTQALFVYDPTVDASYVARHQHTAFVANDGKGYRLSLAQPISPTMFGARVWRDATFNPLDPLDVRTCPDSTSALQSFFDFIFANDGVIAEVNGRYGIAGTLRIGPQVSRPNPARQFRGEMMLVALAPIAGPMIHAHNLRDHIWLGSITCVGRGGTAFALRDVEVGIRFTGDCTSFRITGRAAAYYMAFANVVGVTEPSIDFLEWLTISEVTAYACGAGPVIEDGASREASRLTTSFTVSSWNGTPSDNGQTTTLEVAALPPPAIDHYGRVGVHHGVLIRIRELLYRVTAIDRSKKSITVFPWVDRSVRAGELDYIFGGNLVLGGGDANLCHFESVESAFTSVNYQCCGLFPGRVATLTAQACTINLLLAGGPTRVSGGTTAGLYQENTLHGLVCASPGNVSHTLIDADNTDFGSWIVMGPRNAEGLIETSGLRGVLVVGKNGRTYRTLRIPGNHEEANDRLGGAYTVDGSNIVVSDSDNFTIILQQYDFALDRLFGIDWLDITITGTGADGGPVGIIAIDAKQIANTTVNGVAKLEFQGDGWPMRLVVTADHQTGAFLAAKTPMQS